MAPAINREMLERLYKRYNRPEFIHPDPVEFLHGYGDVRDREIVGLVASSLAYGRVTQILESVSYVLSRMRPSPLIFIRRSSLGSLRRAFTGFKHRWTTGEELAAMLFGAKHVIERYGSLHECFTAGVNGDGETILAALSAFAEELKGKAGAMRGCLIPSPSNGSACKRLNLFLRWMVRRDEVDPGGWEGMPASRLIIPLDTHMHRICRALKLTKRKQADMRTALEVTAGFRRIAPEDPVRYDFALTRLGIRSDADPEAFFKLCSRDPRDF